MEKLTILEVGNRVQKTFIYPMFSERSRPDTQTYGRTAYGRTRNGGTGTPPAVPPTTDDRRLYLIRLTD